MSTSRPAQLEDDELTNTDLESNKVVYVSSQQLGEGMSPIKVEDESEDVIMTPGRANLNNRKLTVGLDSRRSNERSSNPDRAKSNKKGSVSNNKKPPTFAAQGSVRYSVRGA